MNTCFNRMVLFFLCTISSVYGDDFSFSEQSISDSIQVEDIEAEKIIVILGKVPKPIGDVFGAASVIGRETIENELAHNIADLVRYQTGISIENAGTRFGLSGFTIRGIGGNRVATEIDGVPVADQFGIGSYSNSGRNFIDLDILEQVEILRGPASSTYGSNAIGGVVSFVTKKPVDLLSKTENDIYVGLKTGYYGVDNSHSFSINTAFSQGSSSGLLTMSSINGHEFDNNASDDTAIDRQDKQVRSMLAKYFFDVSNDLQLSISYDYFSKESDTEIESLLGRGRFRSTIGLLGDDLSSRKNTALAVDFKSELDWLDGGVVRLYQQRTKTEQLTDERRFSRGTNLSYDRDFFYKQNINGLRFNLYTELDNNYLFHHIGYGFEWSERKISELRNGVETNVDNNTSTNIILSEQFPLRDFPQSTVRELGIYFNDQIEISGTNFSLIPALRFDQYHLDPEPDSIYLADNPTTSVVSIDESNLSPKLGVQYEINPSSHWFLQYFEGFRAPPFEDANIGLDIPLFGFRAIPNPDLKSESSKGYEIGYRYSDQQHSIDIINFYTKYEDFIQTKVNLGFDPNVERIIFQSQNIDSTKIYGSEIQYRLEVNDWLTNADFFKLYASLFWSKGENKETQQPLNNIDPNHVLLGFNWQSPDQMWSIAFHASIYAAKKNIDELDDTQQILFKTPGYTIFDIIANYKVTKKIILSAGIYNLSDHQYWRWSDVNGLLVDDPALNTLSASGINASLQLRMHW